MKTNFLLMSVLFVAIQGCAFTPATLDVKHNATQVKQGPLSSTEPSVFSLNGLADERPDKHRIGYKKNGFGANTADITSSRPVTAIVGDAIRHGLTTNGHSVSDDGKVSIDGAVTQFWFDTDVNFWTIGFIGSVECKLQFTDKRSNEVVYENTYSGTHKEEKMAGLEGTWTRVMGLAVDKLVEDISFDDELLEALEDLN